VSAGGWDEIMTRDKQMNVTANEIMTFDKQQPS